MPASGTGFSTDDSDWKELGEEFGWVEAAYVWPKVVNSIQYYYLFVNWGACCSGGVNSTYQIRVGRSSTNPLGPFNDKNGVDMMNGGGS